MMATMMRSIVIALLAMVGTVHADGLTNGSTANGCFVRPAPLRPLMERPDVLRPSWQRANYQRPVLTRADYERPVITRPLTERADFQRPKFVPCAVSPADLKRVLSVSRQYTGVKPSEAIKSGECCGMTPAVASK